MIVTMMMVAGVILLLTAWVTIRRGHREVKVAWVAPLWGAGSCIVLVGGGLAYYFNARLIYERCVTTAERSHGGREQTNQLYDTIDAATGTTKFTYEVIIPGEPSLRQALDDNLPVLDPNDCPKP